MARQIIWDHKALNDLDSIFEYWELRTNSSRYNQKLLRLFERSARLIEANNLIGTPTNRVETYRLIVKDCALFYKVNDEDIRILAVFDTRQNPDMNPAK